MGDAGDPAVERGELDDQGITTFEDAAPAVVFDNSQQFSSVTQLTGHEASDLGAFLARPVIVQQLAWAHNTSLTGDFDPWELFLTDVNVASKIANYQLFKGTLKLKILINGMPFHMGRLLISYWPLDFYTRSVLDTATTGNSRLTRHSQLSNACELNPTTNTTVELSLPFVHPQNYVNVPSYPSTSAERIGRLFYDTYVPLTTSNGSVVDANITVYAWMEDVDLIIPTHSQGGSSRKKKTSKSKKASPKTIAKSEEEPDGLISATSSAVASMLGQLEDVPFIGPYAMVAEDVASSVAGVARFFGFSRPANLQDLAPVKNKPFGPMAWTSGLDPVAKLSFDPNQGISVDNTLVGLSSCDQMSIMHVARKWSFLTKFNWDLNNPTGTILQEIQVYPGMRNNNAGKVAMTSVDFASAPFEFWSGGMEYRIVPVCSAYHRGRLRICYEPYGDAYAGANTNTTYNSVFDLETQPETVIGVGWAQALPYQRLTIPRTTQAFGASGATVYNTAAFNGILYIEVVNPLVAPAVTADIEVLVFVRAGEDFEVTTPVSGTTAQVNISQWTTYAQGSSGDNVFEKHLDAFGDYDEVDPPLQLVGTPDHEATSMKPIVWFGEKVVSFRALIKRYTFYRRQQCDSAGVDNSTTQVAIPLGGYPAPGGHSTFDDQFDVDNLAASTNYVNSTILTYLSAGYVGYRGGLRWKVGLNPVKSTIGTASIQRGIGIPSFGTSLNFVPALAGPYDVGHAAVTDINLRSTWGGIEATQGDVMSTLEAEVPYYTNYKFIPIDRDGYNASPHVQEQLTAQCVLTFSPTYKTRATVSEASLYCDIFSAAADDFSFVWYIGPSVVEQTVYVAP